MIFGYLITILNFMKLHCLPILICFKNETLNMYEYLFSPPSFKSMTPTISSTFSYIQMKVRFKITHWLYHLYVYSCVKLYVLDTESRLFNTIHRFVTCHMFLLKQCVILKHDKEIFDLKQQNIHFKQYNNIVNLNGSQISRLWLSRWYVASFKSVYTKNQQGPTAKVEY